MFDTMSVHCSGRKTFVARHFSYPAAVKEE